MKTLPSADEILAWIADNPTRADKKSIAKAFGIKGGALRIELKRLLREMQDAGQIEKRRGSLRDPGTLPPVAVLVVDAPDGDGDLFARPQDWRDDGPEPRILLNLKPTDPALGEGDRVLARLTEASDEDHSHTGTLIRRIGRQASRVVGIFRAASQGGRIVPVEKGSDREWLVPAGAENGAKDGELVEGEPSGPKGRMGLPKARIVSVLGDPSSPRAVSLIAIHAHGIPDRFPPEVVAEAEAAKPAKIGTREDLRDIPLLTIDPADARDHDDAVLAMADPETGGHILWVAIADVAHYVTPGSDLDREARKRGNSTYFPDRVVPMLPDALSGDLCSLHEGVDRPVIAVEMKIDADGTKTSHRFMRAMMRSPASLHYEEVQEAIDGRPTDRTGPLLETVLQPLYAAYAALRRARETRQPLELDLPERQIVLSDEGQVTSVAYKDRLDAHRLIEEFMVLANVAAAEELSKRDRPLLFRVHEEPNPDKLDALREIAAASGLTLAKGQVLHTRHLNRLLGAAAGTDHDEVINLATLRSMTQAYYSPENFGHFGLALRNYAHFTSPIRRYADLIVHRALITAHGWGDDGLSPDDIERLDETAKQISDTERRSMMAERDTTDRYLAAYLSDRVGSTFEGRISGIARFGIFVKLDGSGADALVPIRSIGDEYWHHDADAQTLTGADTGTRIGLGARVTVTLTEATPTTGGLVADLVAIEDAALPQGRRKPGTPPRRKAGAAKKAGTKARKVARRRK